MLTLLAALMSAQAAAAAPPAKEADPVVCTRPRSTHTVGTRLRSKKICLRQSDWDFVNDNSQRELKSLNERTLYPAEVKGRR